MTTTTDPRTPPPPSASPASPDVTPPAPAWSPPPPPRRSAVALTFGLLLVAFGTLALLATTGVDVRLGLVGPIALMVLGLGVLISAVRGEHSGALIAMAVVVGILLGAASLMSTVLDVPWQGGVGERTYAPTTVAAIEPEYRMVAGSLTLDLTGIDFGRTTTTVDLSVVAGQVVVRLPVGVPVQVDTDVGAGSSVVFGTRMEGLSVDNDRTTEGVVRGARGLVLHVDVGMGEVRVTR